MTLEASVTANNLLDQTEIGPNIILEIDGIPVIFGAVKTSKFWKIGDDIEIGDVGLLIGGLIEDENSRPWISLKGTTNNITQQLEIDKGGTGSISRFNIEIIDKDQEVTRLFQPGSFVPDILSREANVYVSFTGGAFPDDAIKIFNGIVTSQEAKQGSWRVGVDHPEFLKRQDLFVQSQSKLSASISSGDTIIPLDSVVGLLAPSGEVRTAVQIGEEVIEYAAIDAVANELTGATRAILDTAAAAHSLGDESSSFYILEGQPLDLALKMMLSTDEDESAFSEDVPATRFVQVDALTNTPNGIFFPDFTIQERLGLTTGDLVTTTGATEVSNNVIDIAISGFQSISTGTVIILGGAGLVIETDSACVASFKSQYNTLPQGAGCGMKPSQVDVQQHLKLQQLFAANQPTYLFYLKDTINAKEFISEQIYFPSGYYRVDRKGRASVATTIPPLVLEELVELDQEAVKRADQINVKRQIGSDFYNNIVYRYNNGVLEDKFLTGQVVFSQRSINRIKTGNKALTIESEGLRDDDVTTNFIATQARRFNDRFQFAAESVDVEVKFKDGFRVEIADTVLFGSPELQIVDTQRGTRDYRPTLYEVTNKSVNLKSGRIKLRLLNTGFGIDGRFGVISPSSFIGSGSSTTKVVVKRSFATGEFDSEREKWRTFIGERITIRDQNFTFSEEVLLVDFDDVNSDRIVVSPALSVAPPEDYIVDLPDYPDNADSDDLSKMKSIHCFFDPQVGVTASVSATVFEVAVADIDKFLVGAFIRAHNPLFTDDSVVNLNDDDAEVTVVDTVLNRITVDRDLTFTPVPGDLIDLIGFKDAGLPYRLL